MSGGSRRKSGRVRARHTRWWRPNMRPARTEDPTPSKAGLRFERWVQEVTRHGVDGEPLKPSAAEGLKHSKVDFPRLVDVSRDDCSAPVGCRVVASQPNEFQDVAVIHVRKTSRRFGKFAVYSCRTTTEESIKRLNPPVPHQDHVRRRGSCSALRRVMGPRSRAPRWPHDTEARGDSSCSRSDGRSFDEVAISPPEA